MSDLHLEFEDMQIPDKVGDVLVLAGDIGVGIRHKDWVFACADKFEHVIYVLGNHEFYGKSMQSVQSAWSMMDHPNLYVLDNDWITVEDVNFIGSTLWSKPHPICPLNDFKLIKYKYPGGYGKFTTEMAHTVFFKNKTWLVDTLAKLKEKKNVVITHHAPTWEIQDPIYKNGDSVVGSGFQTEIIQDFDPKSITAWIYGHTHYNTDMNVAGIHITSNQRGYGGAYTQYCLNFDMDKYIEV